VDYNTNPPCFAFFFFFLFEFFLWFLFSNLFLSSLSFKIEICNLFFFLFSFIWGQCSLWVCQSNLGCLVLRVLWVLFLKKIELDFFYGLFFSYIVHCSPTHIALWMTIVIHSILFSFIFLFLFEFLLWFFSQIYFYRFYVLILRWLRI
jgi:hypothetical protein